MEAVVNELRQDAQLAVFFSADCNVSAIASAIVAKDAAPSSSTARARGLSAFSASSASASASFSDTDATAGSSHSERFIQKLDDAAARVDRVISDHVRAHHTSLLKQVGSVDGLQSEVASIQSSVRDVKRTVHELEETVRRQRDRLQRDIHRHRNVEQCGELVRRLLRFHQLSERVLHSPLQSEVSRYNHDGSKDSNNNNSKSQPSDAVTKDQENAERVSVSIALREIENLLGDPRFEELSVVRRVEPNLRRLTASLRKDGKLHLQLSVRALSQADVGDAVQILFYLGSLAETVQSTVNDVIQEVERQCSAAISERALVRRSPSSQSGHNETTAGSEAVTVQRSDVWKAIQDVFECVRSHALQVWNLQRVLAKMTVPHLSTTSGARAMTSSGTSAAAAGGSLLSLVIEPDEPTLFATFWEVSSAILRELVASTLTYHVSVKTVLVASYPRMRDEANRVLNELYAATSHEPIRARVIDVGRESTRSPSSPRADVTQCAAQRPQQHQHQPIGGSQAERDQLMDAMAPLGEAFLDRSFRRLSNPIQMMFPQSANFHTSPPSRIDMQTLARTMAAELDRAGHDPVLLEKTVQLVRRAVNLFVDNSERILNRGRAATAVALPGYGRTASQAHNVALLTSLHHMDDTVHEMETRLTTMASTTVNTASLSMAGSNGTITFKQHVQALCVQELTPCHDQIRQLQFTILGEYLQALAVLLEGILAKMHDESFANQAASSSTTSSAASTSGNGAIPGSNGGAGPRLSRLASGMPTGGSKYMAEFTAVFNTLLDDHIRRLPSASPCVAMCVRDLVERVVCVFIRHACMLRPLEEAGKLRLANDMAQLELALENVLPLRSLAAVYEELRAFRHMIFLESSAIMRDSTVDKLHPSNVWHHMMARAPRELQLPHQMQRWSAARYVEFLSTWSANSDDSDASVDVATYPLGYPCIKDAKLAVAAEQEAWKQIAKCLDAYVQRVSANPAAELSPLYELLQESGAILLAGYELTAASASK